MRQQVISNSNWTECSTIQGVIGRVISKSVQRKARGRFEITSLSNYKRMTCATVQLRLKSGLLMTNQIQEF